MTDADKRGHASAQILVLSLALPVCPSIHQARRPHGVQLRTSLIPLPALRIFHNISAGKTYFIKLFSSDPTVFITTHPYPGPIVRFGLIQLLRWLIHLGEEKLPTE